MSSSALTLPNINFHRYHDSIFVLVKNEVYKVFLWLYKGGTQYVGEYLKLIPGGIRRLGKLEKDALNKKVSPSKFDIPFLYALLQLTCGLAPDTDDIWSKPRSPLEKKSLEHSLFCLKGKRNALCHDPGPLMQMDESDLDARLSELRDLCKIILQEAGQKASRQSDEIDNCVKSMEEKFIDVQFKPIPSGITDRKFVFVAKQEIKKKHQSNAPAINDFVVPQIHAEEDNIRHERSLKLFPGWLCKDGSSPKYTIMMGQSGTGKSTVCRYIYESWITNSQVISDLQEFDLVIPISCSTVHTRDLTEFLKGILEDTISWCGRDEASKFLQCLRILWLVDGFEEATVDAKELLKVIDVQGAFHLMFATTVPQYRQELLDILAKKDGACEVTLSGLSFDGIATMTEKLLIKNGNNTNVSEARLRFYMDVVALGKDILKELKVPLKLDLMLKLWLEGKLHKESGASLFLLYKSIMEMQSEKLLIKIKTKCSLRETEISKRITEWTEALYETAYKMLLQHKFLKIDDNSQRKLEDKAGNLPVNPEDCLSAFLQSESIDQSGIISYCLMHNSHQYFLAAQHIGSLMRHNRDGSETVKQMFHEMLQYKLDNHHIYMVMLHVVSHVALQLASEKLIHTLMELLKKCNSFDAFEILHYAAYSDAFAKETSKYLEQIWRVTDFRVKSALTLLKYKSPLRIYIHLFEDPAEHAELKALLAEISKLPVILALELSFHYMSDSDDESDSYLTEICSPRSKCLIVSFHGYLSLVGFKYLIKMSKMLTYCLKVISNEHLDKILFHIKYRHKPSMVALRLRMPVVKTTTSIQDMRITILSIVAEELDESKLEETVQSISIISKKYCLFYIKMSAASEHKFRLLLRQWNITVDSLINILYPQGSAFESFWMSTNK